MNRVVQLCPFLFAALPVLYLASQNPVEAELAQVVAVLTVVVFATLLLVLILQRVIKDEVKVATVASVLLVTFFSFGHIANIMQSTTIVGIDLARIRYPIYLIGAVGIVAIVSMILRTRRSLVQPMQYVLGGAIVLVAINFFGFAYGILRPGDTQAMDQLPRVETESVARRDLELPDIYYIILDGYARGDVLKELYAFDNSAFEDGLRDRGFYIAYDSRSNYIRTKLSLASTLNMRYLDDNDAKLLPLFENNEVTQFLKRYGYTVVHFDSGWRYTRRNRQADIEISVAGGSTGFLKAALLNDFSQALLRTSLARRFKLSRFHADQTAGYFHYNMQALRQVPDNSDPTFAFIHLLLPHPPYIFDRNGDLLSRSKRNPQTKFDWHITDLYVDQLLYLNRMAEEAIDDILTRSSVEPIIIIQGDHGTASTQAKGTSLDDNLTDLFVFERTGILNAYYLPESCRDGLYPTISPVNSFRMVFARCFGADLELVDDTTYFSRDDSPPYGFFRVMPSP